MNGLRTGKEETKVSLFADDIIGYNANPKGPADIITGLTKGQESLLDAGANCILHSCN